MRTHALQLAGMHTRLPAVAVAVAAAAAAALFAASCAPGAPWSGWKPNLLVTPGLPGYTVLCCLVQEVTDQIRTRTGHLPGVSIAVMGCIVNGPGEMADADFG